MILKLGICIYSLLLFMYLLLFPGQVFSLSVGPPTIVTQSQDYNTILESKYQPDGMISIIHKGTSLYWLEPVSLQSERRHFHLKVKGSLEQPLGSKEWIKENSIIFTNYDTIRYGHFWINPIYQASDGILAFVHVEQAEGSGNNGESYSTGKSRIGLAWSKDLGDTFTYLGDIIIPFNDPDPFNIQGIPYIIKDGYFFIYFNDTLGTTVARASVSEVLDAARRGKTSPWVKYDGTVNGFSASGLGGRSQPIAIENGITHTDAACSTFNQKCYLLLTRMNWGRGDSWIKLYESSDGVNWSLARTIINEPEDTLRKGFQYATIVNADGNDNAVVGDKFFIYCDKDFQDYESRSIYRWTVDLGR